MATPEAKLKMDSGVLTPHCALSSAFFRWYLLYCNPPIFSSKTGGGSVPFVLVQSTTGSRKPCKDCYWPELYSTTPAGNLNQFNKHFLVSCFAQSNMHLGETEVKHVPFPQRAYFLVGKQTLKIIYSTAHLCSNKGNLKWILTSQTLTTKFTK